MKSNLMTDTFQKYLLRAAAFSLFAIALGVAQTARAVVYSLSVPNTAPWYDTGIDITSGSQLTVFATGIVQYGPFPEQMANADGGDYDGTQFYSTAVYP